MVAAGHRVARETSRPNGQPSRERLSGPDGLVGRGRGLMGVQIARSRTVASGSPEDLERLREQFQRQHCVRLPALLEPELLRLIKRGIDHAEFSQARYEGVGVDSCMSENTTSGLLYFLANDRGLFEVVQRITGCGRIGCFTGRVYRVIPGCGHHLSWHDDMTRDRMIAMSINLGAEPYCGGVLQIREAESKRIVHEAANVGFGDGIIFRIAPWLEHRLTEVEGTIPRTSFAGWFRSGPDYESLLQKSLFQSGAGLRAGARKGTRDLALLPRVREAVLADLKDK